MSSDETQRKNKAILKAGKTNPTIGTKIAGRKDAPIIFNNLNNKLINL